jgi:hypothetical protein
MPSATAFENLLGNASARFDACRFNWLTDWLREQKIRILMQLTSGSHPDLPDLPLADDFATSETNRRVLALFVERQQYGRPLLAPRGTRPAIVAAYREAFGKVIADEGFIREADAARLIIKIASGEEVTARVSRISRSSSRRPGCCAAFRNDRCEGTQTEGHPQDSVDHKSQFASEGARQTPP